MVTIENVCIVDRLRVVVLSPMLLTQNTQRDWRHVQSASRTDSYLGIHHDDALFQCKPVLQYK
jgi:hypothetical protein